MSGSTATRLQLLALTIMQPPVQSPQIQWVSFIWSDQEKVITSWPSCVLSAVSIDNIRSFLILPTYGRANSGVGVIIKLTLFHHTDMVKNSIILERDPPPPKNLLIGPASLPYLYCPETGLQISGRFLIEDESGMKSKEFHEG